MISNFLCNEISVYIYSYFIYSQFKLRLKRETILTQRSRNLSWKLKELLFLNIFSSFFSYKIQLHTSDTSSLSNKGYFHLSRSISRWNNCLSCRYVTFYVLTKLHFKITHWEITIYYYKIHLICRTNHKISFSILKFYTRKNLIQTVFHLLLLSKQYFISSRSHFSSLIQSIEIKHNILYFL